MKGGMASIQSREERKKGNLLGIEILSFINPVIHMILLDSSVCRLNRSAMLSS